ncbi:phosphate ABC transporter permease subunit PstC, partial [Mesorhizobium sp. M4B.F.Ca.ET.088.02.2.1]
MSSMLVLAIVAAIGVVAFFIGRQRAVAQDNGSVKPHSRAHYHGWWAFLLAVLPALL